MTPPIHLSTTFERAPDGSYPGGYVYGRSGNPNRDMLEGCLAALECGAAAAAFSSGSAASATILHALAPGDHVVAPLDVYHGTRNLLHDVMAPWGLQVTFVDMTNPAEVEGAMRDDTKLVWVESPSNPLLKITDIARVATMAHARGAL